MSSCVRRGLFAALILALTMVAAPAQAVDLTSVLGFGGFNVPVVSIEDASATEGDAVMFTVSLDGEAERDTTIWYATRNAGTATQSVDYPFTIDNVVIPAGETSASVAVATIDDDQIEGDEFFRTRLLFSFGARPGDVVADGTIVDNDFFALNVIHINDHHSHLDTDGNEIVIGQDATGEDIEVDVETGGFPNVVSKINELRAELDNEIVLHAGDAITGTIFYSLFRGEADASQMNFVCFDAFALGNHEFDDSDQGLADFIGFLNGPGSGCFTPVLAANVIPAVGTPLRPTEEVSLIQPFTVLDVDGEKVGVIGIDVAGKTQNSSSPLETTQFLDEMSTAQASIDFLRNERGINKIVLLTHVQYATDLMLAQNLSGVDIIVGGDSHTLLGDGFAPLGFNVQGPYPTELVNADGDNVCVVQAWQYADIVGELNVQFDGNGKVVSCGGTPHLLIAEIDSDDADTVAATQALIDATPELSLVQADPAAQADFDFFAGQVEELRQTVIGQATEDLCFERVPGQGRSNICDCTDTWDMGGDITQLVTKAFLERSFTAEFSIQNSGGIRIDVATGDITIDTAFTLLPFANTLIEIDMTGAQIAQVLEDAIENGVFTGSTGAMPYASGLRWNLDLDGAFGSRILNLEARPKGETTWGPLDPAQTYRVVANSFIAAGRDGYTTFGTIPDSQKVDTFIDYAQAFIDYVEQDLGGVVSKVPADEYSTQSVLGRATFTCGQ